jgi:hypothetical protein
MRIPPQPMLLAVVVAIFAPPAHAASVTWGSVQTITAASDIQSANVTGLAGANFGVTTGTTATVNNGSVDVEFTGAEPTFGALVIGVESTNTFANWIGGFDVGALAGFHDDADGDGLDNGLENLLGTAPNAGNAGLTAGALAGNTFTFTHPHNATPASDVSAPLYTWSADLQAFHANGASADGITVDLVPAANTPSPGITTVTATVTGTVPSKLFVRLGVTQE